MEVQPLVQALNDLLRRLQAALQSQRQLVADAAHELRTPLAALLLQTQLVERASEPPERAAALAALRAGLDRSTRVVQQLLTLAREEPGAPPAPTALVALDSLLVSVIEEYRAIAAAKGILVRGAEALPPAQVRGDADALRTLFATCSTMPCATPTPVAMSRCSCNPCLQGRG